MAFGYVLDDLFARHRPPGPHPECPERVLAARDALRGAGLETLGEQVQVRPAREEELGRVHTAGYLSELTRVLPGQAGWIDVDTYYGPETWDAALAAAGAAIDLAESVLHGRFRRGLALVRPPGHHAEVDRAMGFCLLNNAALAAAAARAAGAARVAVLDWDVHHGNGTQHAFYSDPTVMYLSAHQYPFYPGTGAPDETGAGTARGTTVNVGLPAGAGDGDLVHAFDRVFLPALDHFAPDIIIVSAGFDMHRADPLAGLEVTERGYRVVAERLCQLADRVCGGRVVVLLEGGYDLDALGRSLVEVTRVLAGAPKSEDTLQLPSRVGERAVERTLSAHADQPWGKR
ncbi:MAG TPA: histone deacetylase [Kofleriaceae bacterium]|nr:histone deacetylase [Kofleriaceae bacterium]